ncbi:MAG: hypothetical protein WDN26_15825 [Chitinophagaceae bacterium]
MKQIIAVIALLVTLSGYSQSERYTNAMKKNLAELDTANTTLAYQSVAAAFERIGDAEKTQWLPYYYAALALSTSAWNDAKLDKDANAEKVKALCDKADALAQDNADKAEILAIRNMTASQQMLVDPQNRYATYGAESGTYLQKAKQLNPNNPRLHYLEGAGIFGTPEQFGGGKAKAKPILEKAVALFKTEQPKPLYPDWGKKEAEDMLAQCQ